MSFRPWSSGQDSRTCPIAAHLQHTLWFVGVPDGCSSTLMVLLTITLVSVSGSLRASMIISMSPGPSSGKVGLGVDGFNPSLGGPLLPGLRWPGLCGTPILNLDSPRRRRLPFAVVVIEDRVGDSVAWARPSNSGSRLQCFRRLQACPHNVPQLI